ncbi:MAG: flagellar assembly peptidoglycan hydrolase FlgJ [Halieaceae bacterium]|jgi:flagellar protein FlgJ|nr:flagellar assembly peptidoglycan hydrolase FlgJ [Halieaceae bacterium]
MQAQALYSDFGSLAELRTDARRDAAGSLKEVASQFESLFVSMMLKSMREATSTIDGGLFDSHQLDSYYSMHDQQLAKEIASQGGLGIADMLVEQLKGGMIGAAEDEEGAETPAEGGEAGSVGFDDLARYRARALPSAWMLSNTVPAAAAPSERGLIGALEAARAEVPSRKPKRIGFEVSSPRDFVQQLTPLAQRAARRLGVSADVLLAQAALETGWGRHVSADASGSSNNLFNIKAGPDWEGARVSVSTLEYRDGIAQRESASFRAYDSVADSFDDYVALIEGSPRYAEARARAADGAAYVQELQKAGYATDPAYADKVLAIIERGDVAVDGDLKTLAHRSLTD